MTDATVIVGAGQAALQAAVSLRQEGFAGPIVMIGQEASPPYQRPPLSKAYLKGEVDQQRLWLKPAEFYSKFSVDLRLSETVSHIDCANSVVETASGAVIPYANLLLATGSRPRRMTIPGADRDCVRYLRTLSDVDELRASLTSGTRLVVIGGGYIGLEVAAVARTLGADVKLVEAAPRLLARVASPAISDFFLRTHRARGIDVKIGLGVVALEDHADAAAGVALTDQSVLPADLVLVGIGAVPNEELAAAAGLVVDSGIVVDAHTRTSVANVFAAGDCARHPNPIYGPHLRLESVPNAIEQAKVAAAAIAGKPKEYHQIPWFWSDQYEFKFQAAGLIDQADRMEIVGDVEATPFSVRHYRGDDLIAIEAVNDQARFMAARVEISTLLARFPHHS